MNDVVERAKELAHRAHAGQVDKAGRPYIEHVARVTAAVADDPEAEAVAWLHDMLEDATPEHCREMIEAFPSSIMMAVADLTRATYGDDPQFALLDEKTADRLRRKYAKALRALGQDSQCA